jgi:hypothetical protein
MADAGIDAMAATPTAAPAMVLTNLLFMSEPLFSLPISLNRCDDEPFACEILKNKQPGF